MNKNKNEFLEILLFRYLMCYLFIYFKKRKEKRVVPPKLVALHPPWIHSTATQGRTCQNSNLPFIFALEKEFIFWVKPSKLISHPFYQIVWHYPKLKTRCLLPKSSEKQKHC